MSTGHKIFTEANICTSIRFEQVLQTASGGITQITERGQISNYVKGIMAFINVDDAKKSKIVKDFVNNLFDENETRKRSLADARIKNNGHFKKKNLT